MIPKIIHYCWFGRGEKTKLAKKCMKSWKKYCPDYQIIEWNEDNYDLDSAPLFVRQAYKAKKWAFVSDYVRYYAVYAMGGVYLDLDVEIIKNMDHLLADPSFFGLQRDLLPASGLGFGAEKKNEFLKELMAIYEVIPFIRPDGGYDKIVCPEKEISVFIRHGYLKRDQEQILDNAVHIYPTDYFDTNIRGTPSVEKTVHSVSIHWYASS